MAHPVGQPNTPNTQQHRYVPADARVSEERVSTDVNRNQPMNWPLPGLGSLTSGAKRPDTVSRAEPAWRRNVLLYQIRDLPTDGQQGFIGAARVCHYGSTTVQNEHLLLSAHVGVSRVRVSP